MLQFITLIAEFVAPAFNEDAKAISRDGKGFVVETFYGVGDQVFFMGNGLSLFA